MKASKRSVVLSAAASVAVCVMLSFAMIGCDGCDNGSKVVGSNYGDGVPPSADSYLHKAPAEKLRSNTWKTIGSVDVKTGVLTKFEPKDCGQCYTLAFPTDSTFSSYSSANFGGGLYNYEGHSVQVTEHIATEALETGDGSLWTSILMRVDFFTLLEDELRLYYGDKQNYLLLKQQ